MKSTYLTLSGSVRNEVGNRNLVGTTIGKITGFQPGIAFLPSVQLVGESESEVAQSPRGTYLELWGQLSPCCCFLNTKLSRLSLSQTH